MCKFFKMNNIECTLEQLYEFEKITGLVSKQYFSVETRYGFKKIEGIGITAKNSPKTVVKTDKGKIIECSFEHLLFKDDNWVKAKNLHVGDMILTKDGHELISNIHVPNIIEDLYDIQVEDVHEFYANNIVSHNSFVVNLPKILCYGRLDRFKKDDIANRFNKHGWISGEIQVNPTDTIHIERKLSPTELVVYKNGEDIGKSGINDYQSYIDTEVVGLPYNIFSNIISLSVNDFKSFISMSPNDKRIIIDKLFAMEVINKMSRLVKEDLRKIRTDITLFDREILSLSNAIKTASKELESLRKKINTDNTQQIKAITDKLLEYKPKIEDAYKKLKEYVDKEKSAKESYKVFNNQKSALLADINHMNNQLALYEQDMCPTCATPFSDQRFDLLRENIQDNVKLKQEELEGMQLMEAQYTDVLEKTAEAIKRINAFIAQAQAAFNTLKAQLVKLKQEKPKELSSIENIISKNNAQITTKETEKVKLDEDFKYKAVLEQLYADDGVKKKILESYLPTLNSEIEYTLNELHFPYRLRFNNEFMPNMEHLGIEINVETLSTGEKKRVDLAVLVSIIRMLKRKYPSLNIFMLDEVLSSIDGDGIYDIIGLLQKTSREMSMNIFIINHTVLPIEFFDYRMAIEKRDGFSDLTIETLSN